MGQMTLEPGSRFLTAKKNALLWSALVIAFSLLHSGDLVKLDAIYGLSARPWLVQFGLLCLASYHVVGFLIEQRKEDRKHKVRDRSIANLEDELFTLTNRAKALSDGSFFSIQNGIDRIHDMSKKIEEIGSHIDHYRKYTSNVLNSARDLSGTIEYISDATGTDDGYPNWSQEIKSRVQKFCREIDAVADQYVEDEKEARDYIKYAGGAFDDAAEADANLLDALNQFNNEQTRVFNYLFAEDRAAYLLFDKALTYGVFFLAIMIVLIDVSAERVAAMFSLCGYLWNVAPSSWHPCIIPCA